MNLLFDIDFPDATKYVCFAPYQIEYSGNSYANIVVSVSGMAENQGEDKSYEISSLELTIIDANDEFRDAYYKDDSNRLIAGIEITVRKEDGTQLGLVKIDRWSFPEEGLFYITASLKIDLTVDFTEKITSTIGSWSPNVPDEVINWVVPQAYNTIDRMISPMVDDRASYHDYLLGTAAISSITEVYKRGQAWVGIVTITLGSGGGYYWVNMSHGVPGLGERFCYTDITTAAYTPVEIITAALSGHITVAANANFKTFLSNQGYDATNTRFLVDRPMTPADLLEIFCKSFECHYRLDASGEVIFTWINRSSISPVANFEQEEILEISKIQDYDPDYIINKIDYRFNKQYDTNEYDSGKVTYNGANQSDWGVRKIYEIDLEFLTEATQAAVTIEEIYNLNLEPIAVYQISIPDDDYIDQIYPGDLIRARHQIFKTFPNPILFLVIRKMPQPMEDKIVLDIKDVDWLEPTFYLIDEIEWYITDEIGRKIILR